LCVSIEIYVFSENFFVGRRSWHAFLKFILSDKKVRFTIQAQQSSTFFNRLPFLSNFKFKCVYLLIWVACLHSKFYGSTKICNFIYDYYAKISKILKYPHKKTHKTFNPWQTECKAKKETRITMHIN
jgi:hypothetical protein